MKRSLKVFIFIIFFMLFPVMCLADPSYESSGGGVDGKIYGSCKNSSSCKVERASYLLGVRISFVNENGLAVAESGGQSFDFVTYNGGKSGFNVHYNGYSGDRTRFAMAGGGNFSEATANEKSFKLFSEVTKAYYDIALQDYKKTFRQTINTSGYTGSALSLSKEKDFFLSLTDSGQTPEEFVAKVNSFVKAMAQVTGAFNADDLIFKLAEGCATDEKIFIIMEPLALWTDMRGGKKNLFGTPADMYHLSPDIMPKKIDQNAYLLYYGNKDIPQFLGASRNEKFAYPIQTRADLLKKEYNFGFILDWANDKGAYCGSCEYNNGIFTYDNKAYPGNLVIPSNYKSIQEFAFGKRDSGGAGCCEILKPKISTMPAAWQTAFEEMCGTPDNEPGCCNEDPIEPGWIDGTVHNCCEDGGNSEAHEYDLDKLFCYDKDLKVDYYSPKCKTDYYVDDNTDLNQKYCKMYCTERVSVEIPGSITATSGRYFQLTTTSKGTKSPYIEGFRRCRVRVEYDVWEKDYRTVVDQQISNYNSFQKNEAWRETYQDAVDHKADNQTSQGAVTLKFSASCSDSKSKSCPTCTDSCSASVNKSTTLSATVKYSYYPFSKFLDYYNVELDTDKRDKYQSYEIKRSFFVDKTKAKYSDKWSAYNFDYSDLESKKSTLVGKEAGRDSDGRCSCTATWKFDGYELSNAEKHSENVEGTLASYTSAATSAMNGYNNAIKTAKEMERDLDKCDYYFSPSGGKLGGPYKGANAEENYNFNASMSFSYTQVYLDNQKGLLLDEQYIQFEETPGCVITGPTAGPDSVDKLADKRYSPDYNKTGKTEMLYDFGKELAFEKLQKSTGDYVNYLDEKYDAEKLFTHDAKYRAECSWDEGENIYYTLTPNGGVSEGTDVINFTEHGQEYKLHLATLDGTYETHWNVSGLGSDGKFDNFFMEKGNSCANEPANESSMFTCKLHVEYEIVLTGYCNGSNGTDTTVNVEDCDKYKEGYNLFSFKVVDPSDLFPNGYSTDAGDVGYNWSSTKVGQQVKNEIESRAKADRTYDRDFLSYSFILSPTDMGHIKNYNAEMNIDGGYSDFNMDCSCSSGVCINCKSRFINELANGNVNYDGQGHSVTGWANKQTNLDGVRRKNGW